MFEFANIWVFWLLPLPFIVHWLVPPMHQRTEALMVPFIHRAARATGQKLRKGAWISKRNAMQWIFLLLLWIGFLGALAKPQLVGKPEMKVKNVRSFIIASDISFSMAARDWVVDGERFSRWEAVKQVMGEFIERREGDRVGLVFFGTHAYVQTPLTTDLQVVDWFLEETDVGMAGQMTSIGKAIGMGIRMFAEDSLEQRVMLLLTDGRDGGKGVSPLDAAYMAKKDSIKIYTLGIGDPTSPNSDLDEATLESISEITGGRYFRAMDQAKMEEAYQILNELETMEFEEEEYKPVTPLFYYPLVFASVIGMFLILLRFIITRVKKV